ncbi:hypothetical protein Q2T41_06950 [Maribacter confluentis]|uniref:Uncharacterized protein n=1 Tax=Maribacter confluentis TaxID=1656093 RepID=A0ABT8RNB4_9FLAO|nr:hypothetical protein [Maribacter confluentis]MDO1512388.1 hypothetical protein [Maribacter confluentis]
MVDYMYGLGIADQLSQHHRRSSKSIIIKEGKNSKVEHWWSLKRGHLIG